MKHTLERETKLGVERGFRLPDLPGEPIKPRTFTSTYFDTEDHRLARSGITLRYRTEARAGVWQLKLPRNGSRLELEFAGKLTAPPASLTEILLAHTRSRPLRPLARLRTKRTGVRVSGDDGPLAEVVMDDVASLDGRRVTHRLYELEIELLNGSEKDLARIENRLREAGARDGDPRPKFFRILGWPPSPISRTPSGPEPIEQVKALLRGETSRLLLHDPGTRLGSDPEDLHQMRVSARRLRAYLRAAAPMLNPEWAEALRTELAWLGRMLGPVRDLDVLLSYLNAERAAFRHPERRALQPVIDELQRERTEARDLLMQALESDRYLALLDRLEAAAQFPVVTGDTVSLLEIAHAEYRTLRRAVRKGGSEASDKALHKIRIKGKRARYATELAEASLGKPATRVIRQIRALQDLLGEHQDAVVCEQRFRKLLRRSRGKLTAVSLGRLIERQCERRREMRASLPAVWSKLERRAAKLWR
ncbi:MAG: CYTH and CHAD domain-containing protein [Nitrospira sp.]|nr:CYTH and CHAD domain-containing protein [Nitrospira sp.]